MLLWAWFHHMFHGVNPCQPQLLDVLMNKKGGTTNGIFLLENFIIFTQTHCHENPAELGSFTSKHVKSWNAEPIPMAPMVFLFKVVAWPWLTDWVCIRVVVDAGLWIIYIYMYMYIFVCLRFVPFIPFRHLYTNLVVVFPPEADV